MGASMLGYGEQPYQTKAMKEPGIWPVVALAVEKRYLSLYVSAVIDGEYVAERYASQLGNVRAAARAASASPGSTRSTSRR
jgi:hypothetical protein